MSESEKTTAEALDLGKLHQQEVVSQKQTSANGDDNNSNDSEANNEGMLSGQDRMELYRNIEVLVKICIDAAMATRRSKIKDKKLNVDFAEMRFVITEKSIELVHKESKTNMKYIMGSHEIRLNDTKALPDLKCRKFVVWVKKLIDDWAKPKAESVCKWS